MNSQNDFGNRFIVENVTEAVNKAGLMIALQDQDEDTKRTKNPLFRRVFDSCILRRVENVLKQANFLLLPIIADLKTLSMVMRFAKF